MKDFKKIEILAQGALVGVFAAGTPPRLNKEEGRAKIANIKKFIDHEKEYKKKEAAELDRRLASATGDARKSFLKQKKDYAATRDATIKRYQDQIDALKRQYEL